MDVRFCVNKTFQTTKPVRGLQSCPSCFVSIEPFSAMPSFLTRVSALLGSRFYLQAVCNSLTHIHTHTHTHHEDRRHARKSGAGDLADDICQCSASNVKGTVEFFVRGADSDAFFESSARYKRLLTSSEDARRQARASNKH